MGQVGQVGQIWPFRPLPAIIYAETRYWIHFPKRTAVRTFAATVPDARSLPEIQDEESYVIYTRDIRSILYTLITVRV